MRGVDFTALMVVKESGERLASHDMQIEGPQTSLTYNFPVGHLREPGGTAERGAPARVGAMSSVAAQPPRSRTRLSRSGCLIVIPRAGEADSIIPPGQ